MHSSVVRVQNVFGFFTSVAFAVAAAIALSVLLSPQTPSASLRLQNVTVAKGRPHYYSTKREEYAHITFALAADLSTLFNWNTKQVYLYITASYPSTDPARVPASEAVVWDAIIPAAHAPWHANTYIHPDVKGRKGVKKEGKPSSKSKSTSEANSRSKGKNVSLPYPAGTQPGILQLEKQNPKYRISDVSGRLAERANATLTLHWNVQPWVGALVWDSRRTYGWWQGLKGGQNGFDFPALKGVEGGKGREMETEVGGERNRGKPA